MNTHGGWGDRALDAGDVLSPSRGAFLYRQGHSTGTGRQVRSPRRMSVATPVPLKLELECHALHELWARAPVQFAGNSVTHPRAVTLLGRGRCVLPELAWREVQDAGSYWTMLYIGPVTPSLTPLASTGSSGAVRQDKSGHHRCADRRDEGSKLSPGRGTNAATFCWSAATSSRSPISASPSNIPVSPEKQTRCSDPSSPNPAHSMRPESGPTSRAR